MTVDQLKDGKPVFVANDRFAIDQTRTNRQLADRHYDKTMSLALKLDRARQDLEYWQKIAADPKLSPMAAQIAHDHVRTSRAAVTLYEKAFAFQERNRQERTRRTLGE
jgi:hypothetical protein